MKLAALILTTVLLFSICHAQVPCNNWLYNPSVSSTVKIGDLDVPGNKITVEALINRTTPYLPGGLDDSEGDVVSKHNSPADVNYLLRPNHCSITTTNGFFQTPDICDLELNKTYHIAMVYDGATLKFYRDGFLMSQVNATGNLVLNDWNTQIGHYDPGFWKTQFVGYTNEVRIWNIARTEAQIKTYMNSSLPTPTAQAGLLAYYTFDNLVNKQGNAIYNGTLTGNAVINSTNTACTFTADSCLVLPTSCNNWLSNPSNPSYAEVGQVNITGNKITVEAVFNRTTPYSGGLLYAGDLVSKHNTTTDVNYLLRPNNAEITTTNGYFRTPDICEIELNKTYHVAMVYDGATLKFYRNGFLMSQVAATGNLIQNNWKTRIGFYEPQAVNTNFIGYINEVRIWKVEKSQAEIRSYMNISLPNPTTQTGLVAYYTFDNLLNKQGNTLYNATLGGSASINANNPNCNLNIDSCQLLTQPQTCNGSLGAPVVNITFGNGSNNPGPALSTVVPGATTNYNYASYASGTPPSVVFDGDYALVNQVPLNGAWYFGSPDHTGDPNGYMAFFNAAPNPGEFYKQTVSNLCPGTTYEFAAWVTNVVNPAQLPNGVPPNITFNILDPNSQSVLATYNTGDIAATNSFNWKQYSLLFTLPPGLSSVTLVLKNNNNGGTVQIGNDLAIDDITFKTCGPLTNASFSNTVILDSTGTTNCNTINLYGKITGSFNSPSYQWQVSKDEGINYSDIPGATSLNINYGSLNNGKYLFRLLSAEAGNINSVNCRFISNKIILTVIQNIDSVRVNSTSTSCNSFNLNGLAFTNTAAIDKWEWLFDDGTKASTQNTNHSYTIQGNHPVKLKVTDINGCKDSVTVILNAAALPANPTYTITEPTCSNTLGSINITIPAGPSLEYSINGTTYQASPIFSNLSIGSYNLTVKDNSSGCISLPINLNINAATIPVNAITNTIQPSCSNPLGTINVTSPLGLELQYSIDNTNYQTSAVFNNITSASYNLTVKNTTTGCVSLPAQVIINPALAVPSLPVTNITLPVCNNDKGSIKVISPVGNGIEYSIDNASFQSSVNFANLAPASYSIIAKNINSGCTSAAAGVVIAAGTGTPATPVGLVSKQPDCINTTGAISISSPLGSNYSYSINNSIFQTTGNFNNLTPGNYDIVASNISNGCISPVAQFTVNNIQAPPAAPGTGIIQTTCTVTTGTINITSPISSNMEYSINNSAFQTATSFTTLAPGSYSLVVKNTLTQCVSSATIAVVEVIPLPPSAPTIGNITNPSCSLPRGSVEIASPTGSNFEYSINGSGYQASSKFTNLAPGTYTFSVRNIATSCISSSTPATVNSGPASPPAPTASVSVQPTCIISEGTILISSPSGSNFEYSIDGQTYQSASTFSGLAPKTYYIIVKDLSTGCISQSLPLTVVANINSTGSYLIPAAFSPNHDGINECFGIKYWGVISEFHLIIYNRWGQTVFSTTNPNDCWDGVYNGIAAPQGNYVYYIKAKTLCGPVEKKGNVMLLK